MIRRTLDGIYNTCGAIAALCLITLLVIIVAQIVARWIGVQFPGSTDYAGYFMAASSFFALAYTLNDGAHIRVTLLLSRLTGGRRRAAEIWCLVMATGLTWYFAWYAVKAVRVSQMINDISQGQDATPIWIPQLVMAAGTIILGIAFTDHLVRTLRGAEDTVADKPIE